MVDSQTLRARVLTILGAGLLFTGAACGGSAEQNGVTDEAPGGAGGEGGTGETGAAAASGSATPGGGGGAVGIAGMGGTGLGGSFGVSCDALTLCYTADELRSLLIANGAAGAGGAADSSSAEGGARDEAGAAGAGSSVTCPLLDITKYAVVSSGVTVNPVPVPRPPHTSDDSPPNANCCYQMQECHRGRPFTVDGEARTAAPRSNGDWTLVLDGASSRDLLDLDAATRAALAEAWLGDALAEHASVASFARLTLELMQHGAPAELVRASQLASLDEVEHARACFALAERYSGVASGPGKFPLDSALGPVDLAELARRTVHEGCVGETLAALIAAEQARAATDPCVRAVLERIAQDEARHAELAWQVVRWALREGDAATRQAVIRAFRQKAPDFSHALEGEECQRGAMAAHGQLTAGERALVVERGLRDVVTPCAQVLLAAGVTASRANRHA